jgi:hypothetical protein
VFGLNGYLSQKWYELKTKLIGEKHALTIKQRKRGILLEIWKRK